MTLTELSSVCGTLSLTLYAASFAAFAWPVVVWWMERRA